MAIIERMRCRCENPHPSGPFIIGAQSCKKCGLIANWRDFK